MSKVSDLNRIPSASNTTSFTVTLASSNLSVLFRGKRMSKLTAHAGNKLVKLTQRTHEISAAWTVRLCESYDWNSLDGTLSFKPGH